jgi:alpha-mannosidase
MLQSRSKLFTFVGLVNLALCSILPAVESAVIKTLWEIGQKDRSAAEFAQAPRGYAQFHDDADFMVGVSDAKKDWPYVHPGPRDSWANSRRHSFSILFALKQKPEQPCFLTVTLVDAQKAPPKIIVDVNGNSQTEFQPRAGRTDAALRGNFSQGQVSQVRLALLADAFQAGTNEVSLTSVDGSWMIYDHLGFEVPSEVELVPLGDFALIQSWNSPPTLVKENGTLCQRLDMQLVHHGKDAQVDLEMPGRETLSQPVKKERETVTFSLPAVEKETTATVKVAIDGQALAIREIAIKPVRKWVMYFLSHSHVDIGYTDLQSDVVVKQIKNLDLAVELAKQTAGNPPGERYKWNTENLWSVDHYLHESSPEKQQALIDAIRAGQIELDAFYSNMLTALCRPEELMRTIEMAGRLSRRCDVKIESAMISDVPGYTWGVVPVLASAGIKYLSSGPNHMSRIGRTLSETGDKPFYWVSPSGTKKVLCWVAGRAYSNFHRQTLAQMGDSPILEYFKELEDNNYPYELVQMRYSINGDNGPPDVTLVDTVQKWNAKYAYPKFVIATTTEMMKEFEHRYGEKIPSMRGDLTPYWEDGAGSSSLETGLNRAAVERLAQAETIWALMDPKKYPSDAFSTAWHNAILYDEHTWGAHSSVTNPDLPFTKEQWKIKQAFALDSDAQSKTLLDQVARPRQTEPRPGESFLVCNTTSWPRTDLVILPKEAIVDKATIFDQRQHPVLSQRLSTGELAFVAKDVPALGFKQYQWAIGQASPQNYAKAQGATLSTADITVQLDEKSGTIKRLQRAGLSEELVDANSSGLNNYLYVMGADTKGATTSGPAKITVKEPGPLVASFFVDSDAPGCNKFTREIRVISGIDRVDIINVIDKKPIRKKEGVHLEYPFHVPEGTIHLDLAWSIIRPEIDQLPASCKNWFTVNRWIDVSNKDYGLTWVTIDAPLVEIGGITANLTFGSGRPDDWLAHVEPSQKLLSWVMNNHWYTNYRAEQEGPTLFRYSVRPHAGGYDPVAAMRFGIEQSQPLQVVDRLAPGQNLLSLEGWPDNVLVSAMKPSNDGKSIILRLYEVAGKATQVALRWNTSQPKLVWLSNPYEEQVSLVNGAVMVEGNDVLTLRVE